MLKSALATWLMFHTIIVAKSHDSKIAGVTVKLNVTAVFAACRYRRDKEV